METRISKPRLTLTGRKVVTINKFQRAAERLAARYYRRFPNMRGTYKWDSTSIKDRWYRRQTCHIVRERLGDNRERGNYATNL